MEICSLLKLIDGVRLAQKKDGESFGGLSCMSFHKTYIDNTSATLLTPVSIIWKAKIPLKVYIRSWVVCGTYIYMFKGGLSAFFPSVGVNL